MKLLDLNDDGAFTILNKEILLSSSFVALKDSCETNEEFITKLGLVWWLADSKSPLLDKGLSKVEAREKAKEMLGLPKEYVIDDCIKDAITCYKELNDNAAIEVLNSIRKALHAVVSTVDKLSDNISLIMSRSTVSISEINDFVIASKQLKELAKTIPGDIKELRNAEILAETSENEDTLMAGGKPIPPSAIPNK